MFNEQARHDGESEGSRACDVGPGRCGHTRGNDAEAKEHEHDANRFHLGFCGPILIRAGIKAMEGQSQEQKDKKVPDGSCEVAQCGNSSKAAETAESSI